MSPLNVFLIIWCFFWLVMIPLIPAQVVAGTPLGRWAERVMAGMGRGFDRFFTWLTGRVLAVRRWRL